MENAEATINTLYKFKEMGIKLSIDDFGTGYSSLSYLKRFPIDTLKIDQSFVKDITTNPDDESIASTIIAMAHNLRLRVIAEGVENKEQLDMLGSKGCDEVQGFYFSRPVPENELKALLLNQ
jgi:EAL domain-containing protein (putative c-di-GMP-specific phosphodiesterase class I)